MADRRPNIILFMCDQLRFDALGCYGNRQIHTPHIDSLVETAAHLTTILSRTRCVLLPGARCSRAGIPKTTGPGITVSR